MLRRAPTTINITADDIAAYEVSRSKKQLEREARGAANASVRTSSTGQNHSHQSQRDKNQAQRDRIMGNSN